MVHFVHAAAAATLAACAAAPVFAQHHRTPEVIVTATRFDDDVADLPVNADIVTESEIRASAVRSLPHLLGGRAGIGVRDLFGLGSGSATVDMRGFGASAAQNTLILVDGRRLNDIDLSGVSWTTLPLEDIDRIEILRGAGGVLYGGGATGGVVNVVTRPPGARPGAALSARGGSWGTFETVARADGSAGPLRLGLTARNYVSDGWRDNNADRQSNLSFTAGADRGRFAALLRLAADAQGLRLPGPRTVQPSAGVNQLARDPRGTSTPLDYAQRDGRRIDLDLRWELPGLELVLAGGFRDKAQRSYYDFGGFPDYREVDLDVATLNPRARIGFDALGGRHALVVGADYARWRYGLRRSVSTQAITQPINTVTARQEDSAVYLLDTVRVGRRVTLQVGWRVERQRIEAADVHDPTAPGAFLGSAAPAGSRSHTEDAIEAGARIRIAPGADAIVRAGRGFRFATIDETNETSATFAPTFQFLRPQTTQQVEAGLELRPSDRTRLRATAYRMKVEDEIHLDPFTTGVGNTNLPPSQRRGVEIEGEHAAGAGVAFAAAYTWTRARFLEGVLPGGPFTQQNVAIGGRTVPLVPEHRLDLRASWTRGDTLVTARVAWVGSQYMDNDEANTLGVRIPAHALADLRVVHRIGRLRLSAAVENLFDRAYYTYAVRSQFVADRYNAYPLPGRTLWVGLEYALR